MPKNSQTADFLNGLNAFRTRVERPTALDVARLAKKTGHSKQEAMKLVALHSEIFRMRGTEAYDLVTSFAEAVIKTTEPKAALEYTSSQTSMLLSAIDQTDVLLVARNTDYARTMNFIANKEVSVNSVEQIEQEREFEFVYCSPPFGNREQGTEADGFGGEIVRSLAPFLSREGHLVWATAQGVLFSPKAKKSLEALKELGLHVIAAVSLPTGSFPGAAIPGVALVFARRLPEKKLIGALKSEQLSHPIATAIFSDRSRKDGPSWTWVDVDDHRSYDHIEAERQTARLIPRGKSELTRLGDILADEKIVKADKPIPAESDVRGYLYFPEYALSRVTDDLEDQTVKPKAVYRLPIDTNKANPKFLAGLLNGSYGRQMRASQATGATIQRISVKDLKSLQLPLPDLTTQNNIARIESDLAILTSGFDELKNDLSQDWTKISEVSGVVEQLKGVLDIEQKIQNWWRELPYPLATIYRRYQVSKDPKERLERLLHFFEMAAVYLAAAGTSYVKVLRDEWQDQLTKWLRPPKAAGIERADFGFWIGLANASLKDIRRIDSSPDLRKSASKKAGAEILRDASKLAQLSNATKALDVARKIRNDWKGHGGHMKTSDAERLDDQLQATVRNFYDETSSVFRKLMLVRPGRLEMSDRGLIAQTQLLRGSDPAFEVQEIEVSQPSRSNALAFWVQESRSMCPALPFFRLGAPQEPQETSFYVFNRVEGEGFRWISYQETRQQDFVAPDEELLNIISITRG